MTGNPDKHVLRPGRTALALIGQRFGRLVVESRASNDSGTVRSRSRWHCVCDCGTRVIALGNSLRCGYTRSCGCLRRETAGRRNVNVPQASRKQGGALASKSQRIAAAIADVFASPPDYTHVDKPGARVVRGSRY